MKKLSKVLLSSIGLCLGLTAAIPIYRHFEQKPVKADQQKEMIIDTRPRLENILEGYHLSLKNDIPIEGNPVEQKQIEVNFRGNIYEYLDARGLNYFSFNELPFSNAAEILVNYFFDTHCSGEFSDDRKVINKNCNKGIYDCMLNETEEDFIIDFLTYKTYSSSCNIANLNEDEQANLNYFLYLLGQRGHKTNQHAEFVINAINCFINSNSEDIKRTKELYDYAYPGNKKAIPIYKSALRPHLETVYSIKCHSQDPLETSENCKWLYEELSASAE